jgi:hypothetical protein
MVNEFDAYERAGGWRFIVCETVWLTVHKKCCIFTADKDSEWRNPSIALL